VIKAAVSISLISSNLCCCSHIKKGLFSNLSKRLVCCVISTLTLFLRSLNVTTTTNTLELALGHSEEGAIATIVAIDNQITKIKNIVLMAAKIQNEHAILYYSFVDLPLEYAKQVLDKNHTGSISIQQAIKDPIYTDAI
jgi:hypothetical protein